MNSIDWVFIFDDSGKDFPMDKIKFKQYFLIITYGITLFIALTNIKSVFSVLGRLHSIAVPFIYGLVLAYLLNMPYKSFRERVFKPLEAKGKTSKKAAVALSILSTYLAVIITLAFLFRFIIPQLISSITQLIQNIPFYLETLENWAIYLDDTFGVEQMIEWYDSDFWSNISNRATELLTQILPYVGDYLMGLTSGIYNWLIGLIISVYLLYGKDLLIRQMNRITKAFCPDKYFVRTIEISHRANYIFNRFITGNVIDSLIVGIICFIGMNAFQMPFPLLVSVIIGITNIIPIFGPFIGAVPGIFIILIVDPVKALVFMFFILALQQVDGNIIKPRIVGNTVGLPGLWVLVSIILGAGLFGITGMLLGVPTFALIYSLLRDEVNERLKEKGNEILE
ncbi:AI-2E family transporter [Alkalibacter saccharofermentans]|uniref:Predicted PurR-regulated permease PerM n=1 Tax=Alkalibacter saccharofermentans DSM 14828 TaxID=1120975 RepID=A0A1M4WHY0_9FIRM|nr:AI-2E family transporter [Alkalibacter saccharofermentans]SHE80836.1 Predicted PurR-regulated permease PerM [Alkalibacter saccharofermentans DSM 14828]